jgi:hypothetical protein
MKDLNFYTYKDGRKTEMCKSCMTMHIDNFNPDTFLWLLEKMDVPYIPAEWNSLRDKAYAKDPLKMNGMSNNLCTKINTFEIMTYGIISYIVITIIVLIVSITTKNEILRDAFKYVRFYDYLILFGVTLITMGYIVKLYSKYLKNRVKISSISED